MPSPPLCIPGKPMAGKMCLPWHLALQTQLPGGGISRSIPQLSMLRRLEIPLDCMHPGMLILTLHLSAEDTQAVACALWPSPPFLERERPAWSGGPIHTGSRIPFTCSWAPPSSLPGSPTRSHVEVGSLNDSRRLEETRKVILILFPERRDHGLRGQRRTSCCPETPDSPPLQSNPICIPFLSSPGRDAASPAPLRAPVLWLPLKRQEEGHSMAPGSNGLHF